jgi:hypothetical protein
MIPYVDRNAILKALEQFDEELRDSEEFADWELKAGYKYALNRRSKRSIR